MIAICRHVNTNGTLGDGLVVRGFCSTRIGLERTPNHPKGESAGSDLLFSFQHPIRGKHQVRQEYGRRKSPISPCETRIEAN